MLSASSGQDLTNPFALVTYIANPLGEFLDDLRREMVPGCTPHAHVTILPPRPLSGAPEAAIQAIRAGLSDFSAFEIKVGEVSIFDASDVVYLSLAQGRSELLQMNRAMNAGPLKYQGPFEYHPHITLAQDLTHEQAVKLAAVARRRWAEFPHKRVFPVESLVFVQNTARSLWIDLAHFELNPAPSIRR